MFYRHTILLSFLQELGGIIPQDKFQLLLFLFCHAYVDHNHYYDFIPTANGPLSLQAEEDKGTLMRQHYLEPSPDWVIKADAKRFAIGLDFFEKLGIQKMKNTLSDAAREVLLQRIYTDFPYYATRDPAAASLLPEEGLQKVAEARPVNDKNLFYTIGYEGVSPEAYINTLLKQDIRLLCDVRRNPISKKYGFSKQELERALKMVGIGYLHIPELGIASEKRQELKTDADYRTLFAEYERTTLASRQDKLALLAQLLAEHQRIAITCFEAKVSQCHRGCVADAMEGRGDFASAVKHL